MTYQEIRPLVLDDLSKIPAIVREGKEDGKSGQFYRYHGRSMIEWLARCITEYLQEYLDDGSLTVEEYREFVQMLQDTCKEATNA